MIILTSVRLTGICKLNIAYFVNHNRSKWTKILTNRQHFVESIRGYKKFRSPLIDAAKSRQFVILRGLDALRSWIVILTRSSDNNRFSVKNLITNCNLTNLSVRYVFFFLVEHKTNVMYL